MDLPIVSIISVNFFTVPSVDFLAYATMAGRYFDDQL